MRAIDPLLNQAGSDILTISELARNASETQDGNRNEQVDANKPFSKPPNQSKQQIPRLSKIALHGWWQALDSKTQSLPQDELLANSKAAFSGKSISRERIRELTGPRKRGKKPFGGKPTAN